MYLESRKLIERASRWFLRYRKRPLPVRGDGRVLAPGVDRLATIAAGAAARQRTEVVRRRERAVERTRRARRPRRARRHARRAPHRARHHRSRGSNGRPVDDVATLFCVVGDHLASTGSATASSSCRATTGGRRSPAARCSKISMPNTAAITSVDRDHDRSGLRSRRTRTTVWAAKARRDASSTCSSVLDDIRAHGVYDLATLSVALRELRTLA